MAHKNVRARRVEACGYRGLIAVDIAGFGLPGRTEPVQAHLRAVLYRLVQTAIGRCGAGFDDCVHEDRGDGMIVVLPPCVSMTMAVGRLVDEVHDGIRAHNHVSNERAELRLRVALHAGEIHADRYGLIGSAIIHLARLLDAVPVRQALAASSAAMVVVASDRVYQDVIRHGWDHVNPREYASVRIQNKETETRAWLRQPGAYDVAPGNGEPHTVCDA